MREGLGSLVEEEGIEGKKSPYEREIRDGSSI